MVYAFWWPRSLCNICFDHTPHSLMLHWFRGWKGENAIDYGEQNTREPRVMDLWENKVRRMFCEQHKQQGSARCLKCGAWIVSKHCQAGVELDIYIRRAGRVFKKSICELWLLLGLGCLPRFIEIIEYSFDLPCFDWQLWTTQVQEDIFCLTKSPDFPMPKWVSAPVDDNFGFWVQHSMWNQKPKTKEKRGLNTAVSDLVLAFSGVGGFRSWLQRHAWFCGVNGQKFQWKPVAISSEIEKVLYPGSWEQVVDSSRYFLWSLAGPGLGNSRAVCSVVLKP